MTFRKTMVKAALRPPTGQCGAARISLIVRAVLLHFTSRLKILGKIHIFSS